MSIYKYYEVKMKFGSKLMRNIIISFDNRNNTLRFSESLKKLYVRHKVISTPRELTMSCGLSIIIAESDVAKARYIINYYNISARAFAFFPKDVFKRYTPYKL